MTDILNSVAKWFKERTTSPLYGTFILSVILWNWKFFYILFWQSEEKLNIPRIEYVQNHILYNATYFGHIVYFLILPALSTYFIVWWLSYLSNWAHKKHVEFYYDKRLSIDEARLNYEQKEKNNLNKLSNVIKEQARAKVTINNTLTEKEKWRNEMINFVLRDNKYQLAIDKAKKAVYQTEGRFTGNRQEETEYVTYIDIDSLAKLDALELIDIQNNKMSFSEKGKYFQLLLQQSDGKDIPNDILFGSADYYK